MEPTIWELVQKISKLEACLSGLTSDVVWLTWAIRWLIGLQATTGIFSMGAVYFSWKNHKNNNHKKDEHVD